jgi:AraC-like DNA-binding protein
VTVLTCAEPPDYHARDVKPSDVDARYSVAASAIVGLFAYAKATRIPVDGVLEAVGLTPAALAGPEARVSHGANNTIWAMLAEASGDVDFGLHVAERMDVGAFDVVGHLLARCPTFGEGLERVVAYSRILHDAGRVEVARDGANVIIYPGCRGLPFTCPRHISEFSAASVVVLGQLVTGAPLAPIAVQFEHEAPPRLREHLRIFGVTPSFDQAETTLVFDAGILALPIRDSQPGVLTYLDAYARDVLAKLPSDDDILDQVGRAVATSMSRGVPEMEQIASQFGMSARTLQRRLGDRETTFQALLDGVRRRYAERYLSDDRLSLGEIAFLLGFSEPSNFHRAFRRWTGTTPSAFRARSCVGELSVAEAPQRPPPHTPPSPPARRERSR